MTKTATRRLSVEAALLAAISALGQIAVIVAFATIGRSQGPAVLGEVAVLLAVATSRASVVDFGGESHWVRILATVRMDPVQFRQGATTRIVAGLLLGVALTPLPCYASQESRSLFE